MPSPPPAPAPNRFCAPGRRNKMPGCSISSIISAAVRICASSAPFAGSSTTLIDKATASPSVFSKKKTPSSKRGSYPRNLERNMLEIRRPLCKPNALKHMSICRLQVGDTAGCKPALRAAEEMLRDKVRVLRNAETGGLTTRAAKNSHPIRRYASACARPRRPGHADQPRAEADGINSPSPFQAENLRECVCVVYSDCEQIE